MRSTVPGVVLLLVAALSGCSSTGTSGFFDIFPKSGPAAIARMLPKNGSNVTGTITFTQWPGKVAIESTVHELNPGVHSFYIHQVPNCSSPNAASAGPVWTIPGAPAGQKAIGELPELAAGTEGNADVMMSVRGLTVGDGAPTDVIGHSIVVHDGLVKNPQPEFGVPNGWLACGVIERK